jgi:ferritin
VLGEKIQSALNDQINLELTAFYTYLSMSAFFESEGLKGFASWMRHHSDEEMVHAMKIYDFINSRRGRVTLQPVGAPPATWARPLDVFEDALRHEQKVTASINRLVELARAERDFATDSFLQWFVDEQVEEEEIVADVIDDLKRVEDFGPGLFLLNRELAAHASGSEGEESESDAT